MTRTISILGVTGSIGANTVSVLEHLPEGTFAVEAVTGARNVGLLARQARALGARLAVTAEPGLLSDLRDALSGSGIEAAAGPGALVEAASRPADIVMSAIVGAAGLAPTIAAARTGATIALANKECLVAAGELFLGEIRKGGGALLPVDSEHNALFQLIAGETARIDRLILTCSGGPFRTWPREKLARATAAEAVKHPQWDMGAKISIDSATLFNKALEMIEAHHLFDVTPDQIEVIIHPQSTIHSMIGFADGSILAHLGPPDMRFAIGHALSWPERADLPVARLDFVKLGSLTFEAPDPERFPALRLARQAMETGGLAGCVLNGAKEVAMEAFMADRIGFLDMAAMVEDVMGRLSGLGSATDLDAVYDADGAARRHTAGLVAERV